MAGVPLSEVVNCLRKMFPRRLAASWDNVGLLVEPTLPKHVSTVLITNDLTETVMGEAEDVGADLIVSYHPPLFRPLRTLCAGNSWKERVLVRCLEKRIAVFSPHTAADAVVDGVNRWLISCLEPVDIQGPLQPAAANSSDAWAEFIVDKVGCSSPASTEWLQSLKSVCKDIDGVRFELVEDTFREARGDSESLTWPTETKPRCLARILVPDFDRNVTTVSRALDAASAQYYIHRRDGVPSYTQGMGLCGQLRHPISLSEAVGKVKTHLNLRHVRVARAVAPKDEPIVSTVAVCAGAGGSLLAPETGQRRVADLLITGEMSHHQVLDATHAGSHVILCEHSNSERGFLRQLVGKLSTWLNSGKGDQVRVVMSEKDSDPLTVT